ncbi:hypothetical protein AB0M48_20275 [Lentzea sp. NPDC051208]|uniref:hypothetical protein n=1 Tax=Lentzea sp. NPDC051208 TaxID=3154642 RepID=UPI00343FCDD6
MQITETNLEAHLPVSAPAEDHPDRYSYPLDATIWKTLHGHAPLGDLIAALGAYNLYAAAGNELEIGTDESSGARILDVYTDVSYSPFTRSRDQRVDIRGWDVVNFIAVDPDLTIRFNRGHELEMTIAASLLRRLGQELLRSRALRITHQTISVGTATNENTRAQS